MEKPDKLLVTISMLEALGLVEYREGEGNHKEGSRLFFAHSRQWATPHRLRPGIDLQV
jgi:hypothetical protein